MSNPILDRAAQNGIALEMHGAVAVVRLCRPTKRNALSDTLIEALRDIFQNLPTEARAAVVHGEGDHFCAGLDLSELKERDAGEGVYHSRSWHVALNAIEQGTVPVVAALHGAVVGGGARIGQCQPHPRGRCHHLLRTARRHTRYFCRRRRIGACTQADWRGAHDRHDDDRPCLQR